jgi:dimethylhistidine N-methyltransferase
MNVAASVATIVSVDECVAEAVREGLTLRPKHLPAWLFYDAAGSRLFDRITELPEYYLTRIERGILAAHAKEMVALAADGARLCIAELGAGSAEKTRVLLKAAVERQRTVVYEPVDVSASALEGARARIEREIPGVTVAPRVMDYTHGDGHKFQLGSDGESERRLVLYIGSSIGNFEPTAASRLLRRVRAGLKPGDGFLLGVDLVKEKAALVSAYDDAAGVTAAFNRNILIRLNSELDGDFNPDAFVHRAVWNRAKSRMEMHLVSRGAQQVRLEALNMTVNFARGETIHTENSYKYRPGLAEAMMAEAGFTPAATWTDDRRWFAVCLGRVK